MSELAIRTGGVTRRYGDRTAVDGVDLSVVRGGIYGFLGRNGAGKTTLIRMLLGLIRPTSGRVEVLGHLVAGDRTGTRSAGMKGRAVAGGMGGVQGAGRDGGRAVLWARVGYLVEAPGLYPELTVRDHLRITARYRGLAAHAVDDIVDRLDLGHYIRVRARHLSQGNRQRLGLALALAHRPDLVILDEPVNGLDPGGVVDVRDLLRELADSGVTVFMSTHIIGEVARLADRVGIIHAGRLVEELSATQLRASASRRLTASMREPEMARRAVDALRAANLSAQAIDTTVTSLDPAAIAAPDRVATLLVAAGSPPMRLAVEHEDLESHFLRLTGGGSA